MTPRTHLLSLPALAVATLACSTALFAQNTATPPLAARLASLEQRLEAARVENHIPGLALAIVQDDKILYTKGLGVRDIESKVPVTDRTLFAIGSSSKAFTGVLLGMLIDEGKIPGGPKGWDAPAGEYVPQFKLKEPGSNEQLTLRDLLCHRIGLTRTDLCWYGRTFQPQGGGQDAIDGIFRAVARAEPVTKFREAWHYSNPSFLAAGLAAANAASKGGAPVDWHTLVQNRIFVPLGMSGTNTSLDEMLHSQDASKGYEWNDDTHGWEFKPQRNLAAIAPAGAINSNAIDMAQWLRLELGRGTVDGKVLISKDRLEDTWTPQISLPGGGPGYGLGWMIHDFNGTRCIEHGGNIDGFAAQVAFLPDRNAGVVLLTNVTATPLAASIGPMVWDTLFPPPPDPNALPSEDLQPLVGSYAFDQLKVTCKILVKDGKLHIDVPGQTVYELKWPDKDGKWVFAITDTIKIDFDRATGDDGKPGKVLAVRLYQAGMTFRLPRDGVAQPPEPPGPFTREQLAQFEGTYRFEPRNEDWVLRVENGRLGADVPQQRFYLLKWPDGNGIWKPELIPNATIDFVRDDAGKIVALNFIQAGQAFKCARTAPAEALPTLDEVMAKRESAIPAAKLKELGQVTLTGTIDLTNQGIAGTITQSFDPAGRMRQVMDFGNYGSIIETFDGTAAVEDMMGATETRHGAKAAEIGRSSIGVVLADPRMIYAKVEVTGLASLDGAPAAILTCTVKQEGSTSPTIETIFVSRETGLALKMNTATEAGAGLRIPVTVRFSEYRPVQGVQMPMRMDIDTELIGKGVAVFTSATTGGSDEAVFRLPASSR